MLITGACLFWFQLPVYGQSTQRLILSFSAQQLAGGPQTQAEQDMMPPAHALLPGTLVNEVKNAATRETWLAWPDLHCSGLPHSCRGAAYARMGSLLSTHAQLFLTGTANRAGARLVITDWGATRAAATTTATATDSRKNSASCKRRETASKV